MFPPPLPKKGGRHSANVTLKAALAAGAAPLTEGLSWRILKINPAEGMKGAELVWSGGGMEPRLRLRPGRYYAEATYGLAENGEAFDVLPDRTSDLLLSLNAGTLLVHGSATAGGPELDNMFFILRTAAAEGAESKVIGRSSLPSAVFHVPAGKYRLIARHGLASTEVPATVSPGVESRVETVMNSGVLTLSARAKDGGPPLSGATFFVFENGDAGSRREIVRSKLDEPKFSLPAGQYRVAAVLGMARVEKDVSIAPGEKKLKNLNLNAGGVHLTSKVAGANAPLAEHLLYRVYDLAAENGSNSELLTSTLASPTLFLPAGKYRIESQYGWHNARQMQDIDVTAGEVKDLQFEHKASDVKLRLVTTPGGEPMDRVKWTVKYNGGGTVLISQDAVPELILQAGSYQAMALHGAKTYTQSFEAASNQQQTIEIIAQ